uniref:lariat debranching enzyme-like n=1 Tax=Ciona intestinalis TaxID=7719 RepID=UPI000180CDFB|nr:lariat debranching enzyme-like [Ciona intestinalis]|eukprot:XP_002131892.1 lariat debranching enzyme-like [Ciona intestinalis]
MHIAVEGCCHGELNKIYETLQFIEKKEEIKISLVLCCGDFQAVRNEADLNCMSCPDKHKSMQDFWEYYSGKKVAPYLTIFIGGNHEASNYLQELPFGGWVAPNIYFLGYAGVVSYKGIRIGGLTGIFKQHDYSKGHHEIPPYNQSTKRSVYHIRNIEVFRLKQLKKDMDIMMSHDWPNGVVEHGDKEELLRKKTFFRKDVENNQLGSLPAWQLLTAIRPHYWFSGHLHVKFAAIIDHEVNESTPTKNNQTKFLALDKCLPHRDFLQVIDIPCQENLSDELYYDAEWLAVLKETNHLTSVSPSSFILPTPGLHEKSDFSVDEEKIEEVIKQLDGDLKIPRNFKPDSSCFYDPQNHRRHSVVQHRINNQTTQMCLKLGITDPIIMIMESKRESMNRNSLLNDSSWISGDDGHSTVISNVSINPDEIDLGDSDTEEVTDVKLAEESPQDEGATTTDDAGATSLSSMSEEEVETGETKQDAPFKTPIRLAARFSMNLPSPVNDPLSSTPLRTSNTTSSETEMPFSPVSSSDSDIGNNHVCPKRQSDTDSEVSDSQTNPAPPKFKRRNFACYSQSEDDT